MANIIYHGGSDIVGNGLPQTIASLNVIKCRDHRKFEGALRAGGYEAIVMSRPSAFDVQGDSHLPRKYRDDPAHNLDLLVHRVRRDGIQVPIVFTDVDDSSELTIPELEGVSFAPYHISWKMDDHLSAVRELSDEVERVLAERS